MSKDSESTHMSSNLTDLIVIIPARNEEEALSELIPKVISSITKKVIVIDNRSTDRTAEVAQNAGAIVVHQKRLGYGSACLSGMKFIETNYKTPKFVCFFDGDGQSSVEDIIGVAYPVLSGKSQYCQGTRMIYESSIRALTSMARIANRFFSKILTLLWHQTISDLGPLRVMTWKELCALNMKSSGYGWTIEMSSKILKSRKTHCEIPVQYKHRKTGTSKISGNFFTAIRAAFVMSLTLLQVMIFWRPKFEIC
ncbi:MAG: glycosyltransferase family 2 protein [Candidatus Heimdallarchaeota archaeon]|nr:MAG: glycosyltransferase family 2 protein [Candidatus Heimdallarchaeota archaeon]